MSKYHNTQCSLDGIRFDSIKEMNRYAELKIMEKGGVIKNLRLQVPYTLIPAEKDDRGKTRERAVKYVADFVYEEDGKTVVEDVKGVKTSVYKIKRRLMKYIYGIEIKET